MKARKALAVALIMGTVVTAAVAAFNKRAATAGQEGCGGTRRAVLGHETGGGTSKPGLGHETCGGP